MKRNTLKLILFGLMMSGGIGLYAQEQKTEAILKVVYEFSYIEDTTQRDRPLVDEMFLYLNQHSSLYRRSTEEESEYYRYLQSGGTKETFDINSILAKTASVYHSLPRKKMIDTKRIFSDVFQIDEALTPIAWVIKDEHRQIGDYNAQRAEGHFRGRDYTVWFAPDIPIPFGPWKLQGLPGLILEGRDSRDEVIFTFKSLESEVSPQVRIEAPTRIKQVSAAEYARVYKAFRANPQAYAQATAPAGTRVVGASARPVAGTAPRERVYNNPMELTNK